MVWQNDIVANHSLAKWYFDNMIFWQSNTLATWHFGNMISWDTHWPLSKQSHCSKQTILQTISRNSRKLNGRRTTNPKVFDLHRKNSSKNIMEETDPQEPELCATKSDFDLLIRLRRIVRCAKGGTRLGCVLSSRVPGRRDAGTPPCMNMLWSHALPIQVFHVKTVQPSLNLRCFGHETMSVDLSIGLCCVISVIVCKFCGLRLALPIANKPTPSKYSNRSANTHQFDWKLHLHCATLLGLSSNRIQNPEHDCVAKFKGKSACSCFAAESNRT